MSSTAGDFRELTPLVLMTALARAGTEVLEPLHRFRLELPADALGAVLPRSARLGGVPGDPVIARRRTCTLDGAIPAARVTRCASALPGLTRGEGLLESAFDRYEPVRGAPPERARTGHDPRDRRSTSARVSRVGTDNAPDGRDARADAAR